MGAVGGRAAQLLCGQERRVVLRRAALRDLDPWRRPLLDADMVGGEGEELLGKAAELHGFSFQRQNTNLIDRLKDGERLEPTAVSRCELILPPISDPPPLIR